MPVKVGKGAKLTVPTVFTMKVPSPTTVRVASAAGVVGSRSMLARSKPVTLSPRPSLARIGRMTLTPCRVVAVSLFACGGVWPKYEK